MAKLLIPISNGFEEIEAISIIDICRRAQIEVTIAALENLQTTGAHNIKIEADCMIETISENDFDMIVLPGGLPNAFPTGRLFVLRLSCRVPILVSRTS